VNNNNNNSGGGGEQEVTVDLHIVTSLARAFVSERTPLLDAVCAACIRNILPLTNTCCDELSNNINNNNNISNNNINNNNNISNNNINNNNINNNNINNNNINNNNINNNNDQRHKIHVTGVLGLASELGPWSRISPVLLVETSMDKFHLWHAAERICESAVKFDSPHSCEAIHTLIDGLSERHMYKQSDVIATKFYDNGGISKYAEARYMHACDTISKVVMKRQFPIMERQVERVEKACERVRKDKDNDNGEVDTFNDFPGEVKVFALTKLREVGEHDTAYRLAKLWSMEYWYNENDAEKFIEARLAKYIQWKDAFPHIPSEIPKIVSSPDDLKTCFSDLVQTIDHSSLPIIGFDVEWGDESKGAALLQLATHQHALLVDIPALLESVEGCNALEETVGTLFAGRLRRSSLIIPVGFSCREDIVRLRASVGVRSSHWFTSHEKFIDIRPIIANHQPKLKELGLSRICNFYLGKPLDKAEQCSQWERRPLTESQRSYAALDAWAVIAVCFKLPVGKIVGNNR
jgi:hypothetical protein